MAAVEIVNAWFVDFYRDAVVLVFIDGDNGKRVPAVILETEQGHLHIGIGKLDVSLDSDFIVTAGYDSCRNKQ